MRRALLLSLVALLTAAASASADVQDGMPGQAASDAQGSSSGGGATWSDLPNGVASRPYLKRLSVVNGTSSQTVYEGGPGGVGPGQPGDVTAVVSAINLCGPGQTQGCYQTPNRVGITFGYVSSGGVGRDFAHPTEPLREPVGPDTVLDAVIGLNQVGRTARWTWANGDLVSWKTSALGSPDGEIHVRLRPTLTPELDWSQHPANGCTATPIRDCEIARSDAEYLSADMVLSLDDTLPAALTGAVFATQHAILGYLEPSGAAASPALDLQMASSHLRPDGSQQFGTLQAFLPAAGLQQLYGIGLDSAPGFFSATRIGDPGTQSPPRFAAVPESDTSSAGLLVTVEDISFSAPTYRLARRGGAKATRGHVQLKRASLVRGITLALKGLRKGTARAVLLVGGKPIARGSVRVGRSGKAVLHIRLPSGAKAKLSGGRPVTVRVTLPGGKRETVTVDGGH